MGDQDSIYDSFKKGEQYYSGLKKKGYLAHVALVWVQNYSFLEKFENSAWWRLVSKLSILTQNNDFSIVK